MAAEQCSALRGRWGRTTVGGSFRLNGFSLNRQPPCVRRQLTPSPAGGRTKRLLRATARAKRSGWRPYGETSVCAVGAGALDSPLSVSRSSDPFRQPPCGGRRLPPFHLAVPGKRCGLSPTLAFSDRCGNSGFASSATGSATPEFPRRGRQGRRATARAKRSGGGPPRASAPTGLMGRQERPESPAPVWSSGAASVSGAW